MGELTTRGHEAVGARKGKRAALGWAPVCAQAKKGKRRPGLVHARKGEEAVGSVRAQENGRQAGSVGLAHGAETEWLREPRRVHVRGKESGRRLDGLGAHAQENEMGKKTR